MGGWGWLSANDAMSDNIEPFVWVLGSLVLSAACLMTICGIVNAHLENQQRQQVVERVLSERPLAEADEQAQPQDDEPADRSDDGKPGTSDSPTFDIRTGAREGVVYSGTVV